MRPSRPVLIAPSLLAADFARLGEEAAAVEAAGADWLHLDVMDGRFVPNISFGAEVVRAVRPYFHGLLDVHLMIAPADPHLAAFAEAGADVITVHAEAGPHLHRSLQAVRALGKRAGVAVNPGTPAAAVEPVLDLADLVLVMSVNPGFGGQAFIPSTLETVRRVRALLDERGSAAWLEVDGGVTADNAEAVARAGADVLVAGSAVFRGGAGYPERIAAIRAAAEAARGLIA